MEGRRERKKQSMSTKNTSFFTSPFSTLSNLLRINIKDFGSVGGGNFNKFLWGQQPRICLLGNESKKMTQSRLQRKRKKEKERERKKAREKERKRKRKKESKKKRKKKNKKGNKPLLWSK